MAGLDDVTKEPSTCNIEKFVFYLQKLNSSDGQPKYPLLISQFKALLSGSMETVPQRMVSRLIKRCVMFMDSV